jgi:hypothetical protein
LYLSWVRSGVEADLDPLGEVP